MSRTSTTIILRYGWIWAVVTGMMLLGACSPAIQTTDGGGTRGGNPVVTGCIAGLDGTVAGDVRVQLIDENRNPVIDAPLQLSSIDTTDSNGKFTVIAPDSGWYNIEAVDIQGEARLLMFHVRLLQDSCIVLPIDTLHKTGTIKVSLPEGVDATNGYVYVPGTSVSAWLSGSTDYVSLDSVPTGTIPILYYANKNSDVRSTIRHDIPVSSGLTTHIVHPQWTYCRRVVLNTSPSGAGVPGDVHDFPVLIRLSAENFDFSQARPDGSDLLFTGRDNISLPCEIERWDAAAQRAEVWVRIDTIFGTNAGQSISMYWGALAPDSSNPVVFDTTTGFQGVWHLGDADGDSIHDASVNRYHGVSPERARPALAEGVIGGCRRFDGVDDYITMPNTAGGTLNFPQDGFYTICAWVKVDTFVNDAPQLIVSKGYEQYYLRSTYFPSTTPSWEIAEFNENNGWHSSRSPASGGAWVFLTGVRQGKNQHLYCNGILVDSVKDVWSRSVSRDSTNNLSVGAFLKEVTIPDNDGFCFLSGSVDELRIMSAAQSNDWVHLCYMNQRSDDQLVVFK